MNDSVRLPAVLITHCNPLPREAEQAGMLEFGSHLSWSIRSSVCLENAADLDGESLTVSVPDVVELSGDVGEAIPVLEAFSLEENF